MSIESPVSSPPAEPDAAPVVDHVLEMTRHRMLALVHSWMFIWDRNTGDAAPLLDLLSPEGFTITLVAEKQTVTTIAGVQAWFAGFPPRVKQVNHLVESVDVSPLPGGCSWHVHTRIRAPGITAQGQPFVVRSDHLWDVVDYGGLTPRIARMTLTIVRET